MRRVSAEPKKVALFMQRMPARLPSLIAAGLVLLLPACQTLDKAAAELTPYGVQLNERIAQWERACKDMKLGPYYDNNPANRNDASCDFLFLKDKHWDPEADQFSRYAQSIKFPPPHDKPQVVHKEGMSQRRVLEGALFAWKPVSGYSARATNVDRRSASENNRSPPARFESPDSVRAGVPLSTAALMTVFGSLWERSIHSTTRTSNIQKRCRRIGAHPQVLPRSRKAS